jgi:hypothetical protein
LFHNINAGSTYNENGLSPKDVQELERANILLDKRMPEFEVWNEVDEGDDE